MTALIIIGVIVLLIVIFVASTYNSLVALRNKVKNEWSQIDIQLKKRFDLIPNIVETVKGYAKHEKETLDAVISARNSYKSDASVEEKAASSNMLSEAVGRLFAVAESYPELKANQNFMDLQSTLKDVEEKIAYSRQFYNDSVYKLNTKVESFPSNIIASMFHFKKEEFFKADEKERENVQVKF